MTKPLLYFFMAEFRITTSHDVTPVKLACCQKFIFFHKDSSVSVVPGYSVFSEFLENRQVPHVIEKLNTKNETGSLNLFWKLPEVLLRTCGVVPVYFNNLFSGKRKGYE